MPVVKKKDELNYDFGNNLYSEKIFDDYKPENIPSRMFEAIKVSKDQLTFKLIDKNQRDTMSLVHGEIREYFNKQYFEIIWTYSKIRQRGFLTYLFELLIKDFGYEILSDKYHTCPGSKEFWQSLIRKNKFQVLRINLNSKKRHTRKANKCKENTIWGLADSDFLHDINNYGNFLESNPQDVLNEDYIDELLDSIDKSNDLQLGGIETSFNYKPLINNVSKEHIRLIARLSN
ncbi:hypothetical protein [Sphingobacterium bovisgrunnientis]|uniref:hypothetical protein n=1 Tax=Sphingobacterium bovisgrunnientis TaxID=1874697 RepID=UPI00135CA682|nr:hypothetical protein [Sphingobacterium bovisgrunnientis]